MAAAVAGLGLFGSTLWGMRDEWSTWAARRIPIVSKHAETSENSPLVLGRQVYQARCVRCHGEGGHGNGLAVAASAPRPHDLATANWRSGADRDAVRRVIAEGTADQSMPGSAGILSPSELDAVSELVEACLRAAPAVGP
jgi:mono/diheme cytochrome c family protein